MSDTVEVFAAKLEALAELARIGELERLQTSRAYLADALVECVDDAINWHRAQEDALEVWCDMCKRLRSRSHICKP